MKFKRLKMSLLLIVFSVFLHGCTLSENIPSTNNCADINLSVKDQNIDNVIVKVNDKCIYHDEINDVFLQQFGQIGIPYSDIVENSIDEIVVTSYAEKLGVSVSDSEIENAICEYEAINKNIYDKALKVYGETTLKQKIKDRLLFVSTKNKVLEQEIKIDSNIIESFKSQKEFHGELDKYSDAELMKRMDKEIKDYAFGLWVKEKRKESNIEYLTLYDKYKNDSLVFNDHSMSMSKFDGKEVPLDGDEKKEILNSLPIFEQYDASSVAEILVKPSHKNDYKPSHKKDYTERAFIEVYFVNRDNNDKNFDVIISDTNETGIDYGLKDSKMSTLCGVDVELSKSENVNMNSKIILRAIFKVNNTTYVMEGVNIEPFEFTKMLSELLSKLTGK
ncbi:MAG: hypothetical protein ACLU31_05670 [Ezakiella sp.]